MWKLSNNRRLPIVNKPSIKIQNWCYANFPKVYERMLTGILVVCSLTWQHLFQLLPHIDVDLGYGAQSYFDI